MNDPKKTDYVGAELKNIVASHSNIALDEINTVIEYEEMTNSLAFGSMEILSWLVFLFGVINLINTTLSNQIARKQENSILRSIGLTQKQLCKMNICEGPVSYTHLDVYKRQIEDGEHSVLFSTHITGDLERAADYITYISYGELFFTCLLYTSRCV